MTRSIDILDRKFYPGIYDHWDDELFRQRILTHISSSSMILDFGAGAGIVKQMNFKGLARKVCGIDLDPRVLENPMLDEGKITDGSRIPYDDGQFDLIFSDNVIEHITKPLGILREVHRVLKPGGVFLFKTPNKHHYMPLIARMTPHRFHQYVNRLRGRAEVDTFPTRYQMNTRGAVCKLGEKAGFSVVRVDRVEGRPEYMRISLPTYLAGIAYERFVNATELLAAFRIVLIAELRKD